MTMSNKFKSSVAVFIFISVVAMVFAGCSFFGGGGEDEGYSESDLVGRWQAPSESTIAPDGNYQYCVFLSQKDTETQKRYGYMWDMGDHTDWDYSEGDYEQFLLTEELHGNGWFVWKINGKEIEFYHFMSEGWSTIPKVYTIVTLTSSKFVYKDDFGKSHTFTKVLE